MKWSIVLVVITSVYGLLAFFFENWKHPIKEYRWVLFPILVLAAIIAVVLEVKKNKEDKYSPSVRSGEIKSKRKYLRQFYVNIGGSTTITQSSVLVEDGVFDINSFTPIPNVNMKDPKAPPIQFPFSEYGLDIKFWVENGRIYVNTTVRDGSGKIVAKIEKNNWVVNNNLIFDRSFDDGAFEVINEHGKVILQVQLHNNVVAFSTVMHTKDGDVALILKPIMWEKVDMNFIAIAEPSVYDDYNKITENSPSYNTIFIKPIFKYPSEKYFGERAN